MSINMDKMRKSKRFKNVKSDLHWRDICGYDGDGETVGVPHDGTLEHISNAAALVLQDGEKL